MRSHSRPNTSATTRISARTMLRTGVVALAVLSLAACSAQPAAPGNGESKAPAAEAVSFDSISVIAPADPGGGWDQTARAISQVFTDEKIVGSAPVTNIGGAGGTVGLAALANEKDPATLMVTGLVMVGAVETNQSASRIEDTTPIAKMTEEALVVVVPEASPYKTIKDLVNAIIKDGAGIAVTGGSAGGADHILAGMLLTEAGIPAEEVTSKLNYIANSGGGEAVTMLLGNTVQAGISGVGEFVEQINAGELRALAVSSPERVELLPDTKTLVESGYEVEMTNWRGLVAPGGISDEERAALVEAVTALHGSAAWEAVLADKGWADAFLTGADFDTFLTDNITEVTKTLTTIGLIG